MYMEIICRHRKFFRGLQKGEMDQYSCDHEKQITNLLVSDIPRETRMLVVAVEEKGSKSQRYVVCMSWDLIKAEKVPFSVNRDVQVKKRYFSEEDKRKGKIFYDIFCKPSGKIYHFMVFALGSQPHIYASMTKKELAKILEDHVIDSAEVIARYESV